MFRVRKIWRVACGIMCGICACAYVAKCGKIWARERQTTIGERPVMITADVTRVVSDDDDGVILEQLKEGGNNIND